jgi:hypothetical protein
MSKYFGLKELSRSAVAERQHIDNEPTYEDMRRMCYLMEECLDPIREAWGNPIMVNSGYRSRALNEAVGGAPTSQHLTGEAADITTGSIGGNKALFGLIQSLGVDFDQLIDEQEYSWIHISCRYKGKGNRKQVLHL